MKLTKEQIQRITSVFSPSCPIENPTHFIGREAQKGLILRTLVAPGRHLAVFGERGVGKTSLINIAAREMGVGSDMPLITHVCSPNDSFATIISTYLERTDQQNHTTKVVSSSARSLRADVRIPIAGGGADSTRKTETTQEPLTSGIPSTNTLAAKYFIHPGLFFIDEFDRLSQEDTKTAVADLVKILSDYKSPVKVALAGVSNSALDLIGNHPSTVRCLTTISVPRMTRVELQEIALKGFRDLRITPTQALIDILLTASCGLPYFVHLLCEELSIRSLLTNNAHQDRADLFQILGSTLASIGEDIHSGFRAALVPSVSLVPETDQVDHTDQYETDCCPAEVRKLAIFGLAMSDSRELDDAARNYNKLFSLGHVSIPKKYHYVDYEEIYKILGEVVRLSNIIQEKDESYVFRNALYRGYAWLSAANKYGEEAIIKVVNRDVPKNELG